MRYWKIRKHKIFSLVILLLLISVDLFAEKIAVVVNSLQNSESISIVNLEENNDEHAINYNVLSLGKAPNDLKISGNLAYVINSLSDNLQIIDLKTLQNVKIIPIGAQTLPQRIALIDDTKAYVTCNGTNQVAVLDLKVGNVRKFISVGLAPWGITTIGKKAYVTNSAAISRVDSWQVDYLDESSVSVIDTETDQVLTTIPIPINGTKISSDNLSKVFLLSTGNYGTISGKLVVIDANSNSVEKIIDLRTTPNSLAVRNSDRTVLILVKSGGGLTYDIANEILTSDGSSTVEALTGGFDMTIDRDETIYLCVPDWTGGGEDQLRLVGLNNQLLKTYFINRGRGTSIVAIGELESDSVVEPAKNLFITKWATIKNTR